MAAAVARPPPIPSRSSTPPPTLSINTSSRGTPAPVPNKHLPICSPGPRPDHGLQTPPASPPQKESVIEQASLLFPPDAYDKLPGNDTLYSISAAQVARAVDHLASQPIPDPKQVFPWLHGLHAENQMQLQFFVQRRKALRKTPKCIRGITIVKVGGDLSHSKLRGAISPEELMPPQGCKDYCGNFIDVDPRDGFSVRNFQIQACKMATVSDVVVYADVDTSRKELLRVASKIALSQKAIRKKSAEVGEELPTYNTFVVSDSFKTFETDYPELVSIDSCGDMTGKVVDFFHRERLEMHTMSSASEIAPNVFLGPTPDLANFPPASPDQAEYDVYIEASDLAQIPDTRTLQAMKSLLDQPDHTPLQLEFPSSGSIMPPTWSQAEADGLMEMCHWIHDIATAAPDITDHDLGSSVDSCGDSVMRSPSPPSRSSPIIPLKRTPKRVLIHCTDGYTESTLLGMTYFMFVHALPVATAWVKLHRDNLRNFFAYPSDVSLLTSIQPRILQESPKNSSSDGLSCTLPNMPQDPAWLARIDGSLPSRILPYMYLGNLGHANNPELLKELGISRILSVGEPVSWSEATRKDWGHENLLFIDNVQDNGVDPLTSEFGRCLAFIEKGKLDGTSTLVHCRVGVSRSATICIAEVMNELGLSFPRAYCFVRARRLNVIIQPHLRFTYELLKWEEYQRIRRNEPLRRELEWATICREIALMNKPYSRQ
ncbi:dual specificity protein phosphatase-like protein PPS1 [Rhizodiscina lignyota]|uniref:Dual specificity protein phosphatase-like protein PPS1 n=1 Tax=Rhizodiscina lignyota TaxID=1504668 RepID=A0A9P4IPJ0_9PEZI|nr:dual specificity protein phosphatase-like protein PPS1 [Rhizodiscina lignyota]